MKLFSHKSTSATSGVFVVSPGEVAVLSAFHLEGQQRAVVQKVRFVEGFVPTEISCRQVLHDVEINILATEDITQCGVWALTPCQNLVVLTMPGAYRLVLDDGVPKKVVAPGTPIPVAESTAVGTALIFVDKYPLSHAVHFPRDLILGNVSGCAGC